MQHLHGEHGAINHIRVKRTPLTSGASNTMTNGASNIMTNSVSNIITNCPIVCRPLCENDRMDTEILISSGPMNSGEHNRK